MIVLLRNRTLIRKLSTNRALKFYKLSVSPIRCALRQNDSIRRCSKKRDSWMGNTCCIHNPNIVLHVAVDIFCDRFKARSPNEGSCSRTRRPIFWLQFPHNEFMSLCRRCICETFIDFRCCQHLATFEMPGFCALVIFSVELQKFGNLLLHVCVYLLL
jgi:hypothetical protein